jgi:hypothetical protein
MIDAQDAQELPSIDVIIPTLGRKVFIWCTLDLAAQSHLPVHVILIDKTCSDSISELEYLQEKNWPFVVKHTYTSNGCLQCPKSSFRSSGKRVGISWGWWQTVLDNIWFWMPKCNSMVRSFITTAYLQQWNSNIQYHSSMYFGSGNSFSCTILKKHSIWQGTRIWLWRGYWFGLQLRNSGCDIIYFPSLKSRISKAPSRF